MIQPLRYAQNLLLSSVLLGMTANVCAETATAQASSEHAAEVVILKDIVQQQRLEQDQATTTSSSSPRPQVVTGLEEVPTLPVLDHPVIDPMNLLSVAEKSQINQKILEIYQTGKAQIGVVMVPTTGQQDIFSYSLKIAEDWGLGSEKYDNGALIVVAKNDRKIQILTGYGLEGVLPDIVVNQIIRNQITPEFKVEQYGVGLLAGLNEIDRILSLDPELAAQAAAQLREQQEQVQKEAEAQQKLISRSFLILLIAVFASSIVGRKFAGIGAGIAGVISGLIAGSGILVSLLAGFILFVLIISSIAQGVAHIAMSSRGGSGGFSSRGGGGGGFSGGGGGFGGGGASGSW